MSGWLQEKLQKWGERVVESVVDSVMANQDTHLQNLQNMQQSNIAKFVNRVVNAKYFYKQHNCVPFSSLSPSLPSSPFHHSTLGIYPAASLPLPPLLDSTSLSSPTSSPSSLRLSLISSSIPEEEDHFSHVAPSSNLRTVRGVRSPPILGELKLRVHEAKLIASGDRKLLTRPPFCHRGDVRGRDLHGGPAGGPNPDSFQQMSNSVVSTNLSRDDGPIGCSIYTPTRTSLITHNSSSSTSDTKGSRRSVYIEDRELVSDKHRPDLGQSYRSPADPVFPVESNISFSKNTFSSPTYTTRGSSLNWAAKSMLEKATGVCNIRLPKGTSGSSRVPSLPLPGRPSSLIPPSSSLNVPQLRGSPHSIRAAIRRRFPLEDETAPASSDFVWYVVAALPVKGVLGGEQECKDDENLSEEFRVRLDHRNNHTKQKISHSSPPISSTDPSKKLVEGHHSPRSECVPTQVSDADQSSARLRGGSVSDHTNVPTRRVSVHNYGLVNSAHSRVTRVLAEHDPAHQLRWEGGDELPGLPVTDLWSDLSIDLFYYADRPHNSPNGEVKSTSINGVERTKEQLPTGEGGGGSSKVDFETGGEVPAPLLPSYTHKCRSPPSQPPPAVPSMSPRSLSPVNEQTSALRFWKGATWRFGDFRRGPFTAGRFLGKEQPTQPDKEEGEDEEGPQNQRNIEESRRSVKPKRRKVIGSAIIDSIIPNQESSTNRFSDSSTPSSLPSDEAADDVGIDEEIQAEEMDEEADENTFEDESVWCFVEDVTSSADMCEGSSNTRRSSSSSSDNPGMGEEVGGPAMAGRGRFIDGCMEGQMYGRAIVPLSNFLNGYKRDAVDNKKGGRIIEAYFWLQLYPHKNEEKKYLKPVPGFDQFGMRNPQTTLGFLLVSLQFEWRVPPLLAPFYASLNPPASTWVLPANPEPLYIQTFSERSKYIVEGVLPRWVVKFVHIFSRCPRNGFDWGALGMWWLLLYALVVTAAPHQIPVFALALILLPSLSYRLGAEAAVPQGLLPCRHARALRSPGEGWWSGQPDYDHSIEVGGDVAMDERHCGRVVTDCNRQTMNSPNSSNLGSPLDAVRPTLASSSPGGRDWPSGVSVVSSPFGAIRLGVPAPERGQEVCPVFADDAGTPDIARQIRQFVELAAGVQKLSGLFSTGMDKIAFAFNWNDPLLTLSSYVVVITTMIMLSIILFFLNSIIASSLLRHAVFLYISKLLLSKDLEFIKLKRLCSSRVRDRVIWGLWRIYSNYTSFYSFLFEAYYCINKVGIQWEYLGSRRYSKDCSSSSLSGATSLRGLTRRRLAGVHILFALAICVATCGMLGHRLDSWQSIGHFTRERFGLSYLRNGFGWLQDFLNVSIPLPSCSFVLILTSSLLVALILFPFLRRILITVKFPVLRPLVFYLLYPFFLLLPVPAFRLDGTSGSGHKHNDSGERDDLRKLDNTSESADELGRCHLMMQLPSVVYYASHVHYYVYVLPVLIFIYLARYLSYLLQWWRAVVWYWWSRLPDNREMDHRRIAATQVFPSLDELVPYDNFLHNSTTTATISTTTGSSTTIATTTTTGSSSTNLITVAPSIAGSSSSTPAAEDPLTSVYFSEFSSVPTTQVTSATGGPVAAPSQYCNSSSVCGSSSSTTSSSSSVSSPMIAVLSPPYVPVSTPYPGYWADVYLYHFFYHQWLEDHPLAAGFFTLASSSVLNKSSKPLDLLSKLHFQPPPPPPLPLATFWRENQERQKSSGAAQEASSSEPAEGNCDVRLTVSSPFSSFKSLPFGLSSDLNFAAALEALYATTTSNVDQQLVTYCTNGEYSNVEQEKIGGTTTDDGMMSSITNGGPPVAATSSTSIPVLPIWGDGITDATSTSKTSIGCIWTG